MCIRPDIVQAAKTLGKVVWQCQLKLYAQNPHILLCNFAVATRIYAYIVSPMKNDKKTFILEVATYLYAYTVSTGIDNRNFNRLVATRIYAYTVRRYVMAFHRLERGCNLPICITAFRRIKVRHRINGESHPESSNKCEKYKPYKQ